MQGRFRRNCRISCQGGFKSPTTAPLRPSPKKINEKAVAGGCRQSPGELLQATPPEVQGIFTAARKDSAFPAELDRQNWAVDIEPFDLAEVIQAAA